MRLLIFICFISFLLISSASAEVIISEIMYAPNFEEKYNEWIEIYSEEEINLSGWKLCNINLLSGYADYSDNGTIKDDNGLILKAGEYAIITDGESGTDAYNNFDIVGLALHTNAASTCGGLTNKGKEISLSYNNETKTSVVYDNKTGLKNNMSLQFVVDEWCEGVPTPGEDNECYIEELPPELPENDSGENLTADNESVNTTGNTSVQANSSSTANTSSKTNTSKTSTTGKQLTAKAVSNSTENISENSTGTEGKKVIYQAKTDKMRKTALYLAIGLFVILIIYVLKTKSF